MGNEVIIEATGLQIQGSPRLAGVALRAMLAFGMTMGVGAAEVALAQPAAAATTTSVGEHCGPTGSPDNFVDVTYTNTDPSVGVEVNISGEPGDVPLVVGAVQGADLGLHSYPVPTSYAGALAIVGGVNYPVNFNCSPTPTSTTSTTKGNPSPTTSSTIKARLIPAAPPTTLKPNKKSVPVTYKPSVDPADTAGNLPITGSKTDIPLAVAAGLLLSGVVAVAATHNKRKSTQN